MGKKTVGTEVTKTTAKIVRRVTDVATIGVVYGGITGVMGKAIVPMIVMNKTAWSMSAR